MKSALKKAASEDMLLKFVMKFLIQSPEDGTMGLLHCMANPDAQGGVLYGPKPGLL